ncbi:MAG: DUF6473 family protein [Pseudomonadota bacterium]
MTFVSLRPESLDYALCRYGTSKLLFRGPRQLSQDPYIAFLGGIETYGRFVRSPFPSQIEEALGRPCLNLGQVGAGVDVFLHDPFVAQVLKEAKVIVVQAMGVQGQSNAFYTVHPRRNDRITALRPALHDLFDRADFTDVHYTRHLLESLCSLSSEGFTTVQAHLQAVWVKQMQSLLTQIAGVSIVLWINNHASRESPASEEPFFCRDPLFVRPGMIAKIAPYATEVLQVDISSAARSAIASGMIYGAAEEVEAAQLMNAQAHEEVAQALLKYLKSM